MRKLAYIFCIALFLVGCGGGSHIVNVSYNPIDFQQQFFSPKDKRPVLFIDSVIDNREFAKVKNDVRTIYGPNKFRSGRFEKDPMRIVYHKWGGPLLPTFWETPKTPPEIIREALETELLRFGVEITKDRNLADGVLKASIEKFKIPHIFN